ncbi:hypothetical protein Tco_1383874 [Tanacetum coccineum]
MSKVLQERGFGNLPSSTETNRRDHVKSISTIVETDSYLIRRIGSHQYAVSTRQNSTLLFSVLEDMDAYRDEGMGDVIFGEPFLREVGINAKRFKGMITIHNGNEEVTTNGQLRSVPYLDIFTGFVTYGVIQFKDTAYWSPA